MKAEVHFICGEPVPYRNIFELVIDYEHGDADGCSTSTCYYPETETEELKRDVAALWAIDDFNDTDEIVSYFEHQGYPDFHIQAEAFLENFRVYDMIYRNGHSLASVGSIKLYWYNQDGVKHNVETHINGRKHT